MSIFASEVASQPDCWRRATAVSGSAAGDLPADGRRVAVIGCGTSLYIAQAYAAVREAGGHGETDAFPASEWPSRRRYDAVLAISRSGTTSEVLRCLTALGSDVTRHAITGTATADNPIVGLADHLIEIPFADEVSTVQTRFATSALALLRAALGEDIEAISRQADQVLAGDAHGDATAEPERFDHFVFIGHGVGAALAQEAALKIREGTGAWSEAYPAMEYRHGPISAVTPRSLVWAIGPVDAGVLVDVRATEASVINSGRDPMAELVAVHRFTGALAALRGRDIDNPPHLNRSVILG